MIRTPVTEEHRGFWIWTYEVDRSTVADTDDVFVFDYFGGHAIDPQEVYDFVRDCDLRHVRIYPWPHAMSDDPRDSDDSLCVVISDPTESLLLYTRFK